MRRGLDPPLLGTLAAAGLAVLACAPPPPLAAEFAGCESVREGPVCAVRPGTRLLVWLPVPEGAQVFLRRGGVLSPSATPVQGGRRVEIEVDPDARRLRLRTAGAVAGSFDLALRRSERPEWLQEAAGLLAAGRYETVRGLLRARGPALAACAAAWARSVRARLAAAEGRAEEAVAQLARAAAEHTRCGHRSEALLDRAMLLHLRIRRRDYAGARSLLAGLEPRPGDPAEVRFQAIFYSALLADRTGDLRTALRESVAARALAERLGLDLRRIQAAEIQARVLQDLGRTAEAAALFAALARADLPDCDRAQVLNNAAWAALIAAEAGEPVASPLAPLEEASRLLSVCPVPGEQVNVRLNLALAHLHTGEVATARDLWAAAQRQLDADADQPPLLRSWALELKGRLALAAGAVGPALDAYERLAALARATSSPEDEWRSAFGRAQTLEAMGQGAEALATYAAAEALLDRESLWVPLHEGRATFLAQRAHATRRHLDLLLRAGRPADALALARRDASRVLRGLWFSHRLRRLSPPAQASWDAALNRYEDARADIEGRAWRIARELPTAELGAALADLAAERAELAARLDEMFAALGGVGAAASELPAIASGELLLAFHPLPRGWAGFLAGPAGVEARRLELPAAGDLPGAELARRLLEPFTASLTAAARLRVVATGALAGVDFHALPAGEVPLLARLPVVYGLELAAGEEGRAPSPSGGGEVALVVADPRGDLPAARLEGAAVAASLAGEGGWGEVAILAGEEADRAALRERLARAALLHYAGHAAYGRAGGWDGWLPLARDGRLTVQDVLALPRVPRYAVLSGCESGGASRDAEPQAAERMSLAHAFLVAGGEAVVAAVRPVADPEARWLMEELYRRWRRRADLAGALRAAQLALRERQPGADWASFRVMVR